MTIADVLSWRVLIIVLSATGLGLILRLSLLHSVLLAAMMVEIRLWLVEIDAWKQSRP